jgi:hypothetical protein
MDLTFLGSNRFWILVLGCLVKFLEGGFTFESFAVAFGIFATGFIGIRTFDRFGEKVGAKR